MAGDLLGLIYPTHVSIDAWAASLDITWGMIECASGTDFGLTLALTFGRSLAPASDQPLTDFGAPPHQ